MAPKIPTHDRYSDFHERFIESISEYATGGTRTIRLIEDLNEYLYAIRQNVESLDFISRLQKKNKFQYIASMLACKGDPLGRHMLCDGYTEERGAVLLLAGEASAYIQGRGYYGTSETETDNDGNSWARSHTPDGVSVEGAGLGFVLYSMMSLGASTYGRAAGIYSVDGSRSSSAEQWWESALRRGYAKRAHQIGRYGISISETESQTFAEDVSKDVEITSEMIADNFVTFTADQILDGVDEEIEDADGRMLPLSSVMVLGIYYSPSRIRTLGKVVVPYFSGPNTTQLIYIYQTTDDVEVEKDVSEYNFLPSSVVKETPFVLFGVDDPGRDTTNRYGIGTNHSFDWQPETEIQAVKPPWRAFAHLYDFGGYAKFSHTTAEFAARAFHGNSVPLAVALFDAIARIDEDLAVAYASRPDIAPIFAGSDVLTRIEATRRKVEQAIYKRKMGESQMPLPGINGLSPAAMREVKSQLGAVLAGQPDFGPTNNLLKLPKLSADARAAARKYDLD